MKGRDISKKVEERRLKWYWHVAQNLREEQNVRRREMKMELRRRRKRGRYKGEG